MQALAAVTLTGSQQTVNLTPLLPGPNPVRFANESAYALQIVLGGDTHWLNPWTVDVYRPPQIINQIVVIPSVLTASLAPPTSSKLLITLAEPGEGFPGAYPMNLDRQSSAYSQQILLDTINITTDGQLTLHSNIVVPPGTHAIGVVSDIPTTLAGGISYIQVYGNVSNSFYFNIVNPDFAALGAPAYTPILSGVDTQLGFQVAAVNPATSKPFHVYLVALLDPLAAAVTVQNKPGVVLYDSNGSQLYVDGQSPGDLGVTLAHALPAVWQAPNQLPVRLTVALTGGATPTKILDGAGKTIRFFGVSVACATAFGNSVYLTNSTTVGPTTVVYEFGAFTTNPVSFSLPGGMSIGAGNSLYLSADTSGTVRGVAYVSY